MSSGLTLHHFLSVSAVLFALSVVGTDELAKESGYFEAKLAQEELISGGPIPYTIVHATQFFEFIGRIADSADVEGTVRLPNAFIQPMYPASWFSVTVGTSTESPAPNSDRGNAASSACSRSSIASESGSRKNISACAPRREAARNGPSACAPSTSGSRRERSAITSSDARSSASGAATRLSTDRVVPCAR